jgi:hypothetical protein
LGNPFKSPPNTSAVLAGPNNTVVGPGLEFGSYAGLANIDISDTNILITLTLDAALNNVAFDGFRFFDVNGTIPAITSVTLSAATNYAGFTASRVTFDADTIFVNVENLPGLNGQKISLDLNASTAVPEPGAFVVVGAAFALAAMRALRSAKTTRSA